MSVQDLFVGGYHLYFAFYESNFSVFENAVSDTRSRYERCFAIVGDKDGKSFRSSNAYRELGQRLAALDVDGLCCYGEESRVSGQTALESGLKAVSFANTRQELVSWIQNNIRLGDAAVFGGGKSGSGLLEAIDEAFGTSYVVNLLDIPKEYASVHARFRFVGEGVEFFRNEVCGEDDVTIPDAVGGVVVTRIAPNAFSRCRELRSVAIPDTVVNIGNGAFYICPQLTSVSLPQHLKMIENSAFNYCTALERLELPDGLLHIGRRAFYDCRSLRQIRIPASVGFIGEEAFGNCPNAVLLVERDSYAEQYCRDNNLPYKIV